MSLLNGTYEEAVLTPMLQRNLISPRTKDLPIRPVNDLSSAAKPTRSVNAYLLTYTPPHG